LLGAADVDDNDEMKGVKKYGARASFVVWFFCSFSSSIYRIGSKSQSIKAQNSLPSHWFCVDTLENCLQLIFIKIVRLIHKVVCKVNTPDDSGYFDSMKIERVFNRIKGFVGFSTVTKTVTNFQS
jgi:hypothetical protein